MSPHQAARVYRALLRFAPRKLRETHADEMEALFMERWSESRGASVSVWASAILDLARARLRDQRRAVRLPWEPRTKARRTDMIGHDLRYALRSLLRQRLAGALVVAMLALGLAANVAVFGLINGLFLRPLPFPEPERLVYINERAPRWNLDVVGINYPDLDQWRREQRQFEAIAYYDGASFNASDGTNALRIEGAHVTHDFAAVLGVKPILGRFFTAEEDRPKGPQVVVISYGLWQDRFGGERDVLGKALRLDGVARTVIGVMPRGVDFPGGIRCYVPLAAELRNDGQSYSGIRHGDVGLQRQLRRWQRHRRVILAGSAHVQTTSRRRSLLHGDPRGLLVLGIDAARGGSAWAVRRQCRRSRPRTFASPLNTCPVLVENLG